VMVADQVRDYLEHGNIVNAVNFPDVSWPRGGVPGRDRQRQRAQHAGQISTAMAKAGLNIHNMLNKSRGEMAYTLVDVDSRCRPQPGRAGGHRGVLSVRYLPAQC